MKEKIKKIVPVVLALVLVFSNCIPVSAQSGSAVPLNKGQTQYSTIEMSNSRGFTYYAKILDSQDVVYHLVVLYKDSNGYYSSYVINVSRAPFTMSDTYALESNLDIEDMPGLSTSNVYDDNYNGSVYYFQYLDIGLYNATDLVSSNVPVIYADDFEVYDGDFLSLVDYLYENNFEVPSHGGGGGSFGSYAGSPSVDIELPENLRYLCFFESSIDDYVHQIQWDMPDDDSLNTEVMLNVSWKEGTLELGDLRYKKWHALKNEDDFDAASCFFSFNESATLDMIFEDWGIDRPVTANISEVYIRFSKEIDGVVNYSLWTKIFVENLDASNDKADSITGSFSEGNWNNQSVQGGAIVDGSDWVNIGSPGYDSEGNLLPPSSNDSLSFDSWSDFLGIFSDFGSALSGAFAFVGNFPQMIGEFFSFLPPGIISILGLGLIMAVVLRFLGR